MWVWDIDHQRRCSPRILNFLCVETLRHGCINISAFQPILHCGIPNAQNILHSSFGPFQLHVYYTTATLIVSLCALQHNLRNDANTLLHDLIKEGHIQDIVSGYFDQQCSFQYSNVVICGDTSTCNLFCVSVYFVFSLPQTFTFSTTHVLISRTSLNFFHALQLQVVSLYFFFFFIIVSLAIATTATLVHLQQNQEAQLCRDHDSPLNMVAICENYIQRLRSLAVEVS